ncbi:MAG: RsmB/NOP family class I SAM-dependent RNA methyltransferase [Psychroflexus sp.]|nr:RsmB/NOP family class I SAM-dependent RNA methyltransferase [Psychroflexus sp.]
MRLHRNLVFAVVDCLQLIFNKGEYADKQLRKTLKLDKRWGSRDRGFIAETVYDIVRWQRLYAKIGDAHKPYKQEDLFRMFAVWATLKGIKLAQWPQFHNTPTRRIKGRFDELSKIRKYKASIPDWLDELGLKELGNLWEEEIYAQNETAPVILRANQLLTNRSELIKSLANENIYAHPVKGLQDAVRLKERADVFKTETFKKGWFEVQDSSSQQVTELLSPEPGQRIVDTCAGAGGKTLHIASLMQNKGQIISLDIYKKKLVELKRRARRAKAFNIETRHIDNNKVIKKLHGSADAVLIDAPCSGLGVLRRNPDAKWKLKPDFITKIQQTQQELLQAYSKLLKPKGTLVYATCSILPSENTKQVQTFLTSEAGQGFKLIEDRSILTHQTGQDGFYMAKLKKV